MTITVESKTFYDSNGFLFNRQGVGIVTGTSSGNRLEYITSSPGSVSALMAAGLYFLNNHNDALTYFGRPRVASNAFNSNSFTHALLLAAGIEPPEFSSLGMHLT